jgi:hypothetical protein
MNKIKKYFWNILISIDQLANTILLGDPDETISSRLGKMMRSKTAGPLEEKVCKVLHALDPDHCEESIEEDEGKNKI